MACLMNLEVRDQRSFSFSIDPGIQIAINRIHVLLSGAFGYGFTTSRCWQLQGGSSAWGPCQYGQFRAKLEVWRGRVARVTSTYQWWVVYTGGPPECVNLGGPHNVCQTQRISTVKGDYWGSAYVEAVSVRPCSK